ncbi:hypothetical protein RHMOL_Rhmol10G0166300 [Rhododendron molle]|uniref:Uncharacterized protein n=1 Tax=Rhododendron molle TaxID=49168 RepID=A0ACC0M3C1_RHOML|nr:hypothetical protein RHMOL_Rhmol10G0166300 [Rhododendron molle]
MSDGGRGGEGHGDGDRGNTAGPSGTSFLTLFLDNGRDDRSGSSRLSGGATSYSRGSRVSCSGAFGVCEGDGIGHDGPGAVGVAARGGASRGIWRKSVCMVVHQVSSAGSREEPPSKRARHSARTEEEPIAVSDEETDEPTDVDLADSSGSTVPRVTGTQEVTSSQAAEEVSEEDEEAGEDRDDDEC